MLARARFLHAAMQDDATAKRLYQEVIAELSELRMSKDSAATLGEIAGDGLRKIGSRDPTMNGWRKRERVPAFQATTTGGRIVDVPESYHGKVLMIEFWATWCVPCVKEIPNIVDAYEKYHPKGLEILGVSLDLANAREVLAHFTDSHRMPWPQIYDGRYVDSPIANLFRVTGVEHPAGVPYALIVDGDTGFILASVEDARGRKLVAAIEEALSIKKSSLK